LNLLCVILFFIVWRVTLFGVGSFADSILKYKPSFPYYYDLSTYHLPRWVYSWAGFDGVHYLTIAKHGYIGTGLVQAFFPLYPLVLLHTVYFLFNTHINLIFLGLLFSNIFALTLSIVWFLFVRDMSDTKTAWVALLLLFFFPTSFFLGAFYTESLFLLLVVLTFFSARKKFWFLSSLFAGLAIVTRVVGIFLIPALLIEMWMQEYSVFSLDQIAKKSRFFLQRYWPQISWLVISCIGLVIYMTFLNHEFHDPFYFLHIQSSFGGGRQSSFVLYPQVVWRSVKILHDIRPFDLKYLTYTQEFLFGTLGLVCVLASFKFVRLSYAVFSLCAFLVPPLTGSFSSMPRYTLVSFSIFIMLATLLQKRRFLQYLYFLSFAVYLVLNTVLFIQGYWIA